MMGLNRLPRLCAYPLNTLAEICNTDCEILLWNGASKPNAENNKYLSEYHRTKEGTHMGLLVNEFTLHPERFQDQYPLACFPFGDLSAVSTVSTLFRRAYVVTAGRLVRIQQLNFQSDF